MNGNYERAVAAAEDLAVIAKHASNDELRIQALSAAGLISVRLAALDVNDG